MKKIITVLLCVVGLNGMAQESPNIIYTDSLINALLSDTFNVTLTMQSSFNSLIQLNDDSSIEIINKNGDEVYLKDKTGVHCKSYKEALNVLISIVAEEMKRGFNNSPVQYGNNNTQTINY